MPGTATTNVEMTSARLAELERMEGPWLQGMATSDPETTAAVVRLLLAQMTRTSKRLLGRWCLTAWTLNHRQRLVNGLDSVNGLNL